MLYCWALEGGTAKGNYAEDSYKYNNYDNDNYSDNEPCNDNELTSDNEIYSDYESNDSANHSSSDDIYRETANYFDKKLDQDDDIAMDTDYNDAQRFINVAIRDFKQGFYDRAIKLLRMANRLDPNSEAEELLDLVSELKMKSQSKRRSGGTNQSTAPGGRQGRSTSSTNDSTAPDYTPKQLDAVERINKNCKNLYEVLNVSRDASPLIIKRAYRKFALLLHPDKNHAPGAAEAFKTLVTAFSVLADERKREEYDDAGAEGLDSQIGSSTTFPRSSYQNHTSHSHRHTPDSRVRPEDLSTEELFNMFFSTYPSPLVSSPYNYPFGRASAAQPQPPSLAFGFIVVLILMAVMISLFASSPFYTLKQSSVYSVRRQTHQLSIPYYVKESFESDYQDSVASLEKSVEEDFMFALKQNCYNEKNYRMTLMARARNSGNRMWYLYAQNLKMPSCENLWKMSLIRYKNSLLKFLKK